jgi:hypothetical protein
VDLDVDQVAKLDSVVDRVVKTGTPEQKQATKDLFHKVLSFQIVVKEENDWVDANFPPAEEEEV